MNLSEDTVEKLEVWAKPETWHTNHDLDMHRFFGFVDQYAKDHGYTVDESELHDRIASVRNTPTGDDNPLEETIRSRISLMVNILDFLQVTGR